MISLEFKFATAVAKDSVSSSLSNEGMNDV